MSDRHRDLLHEYLIGWMLSEFGQEKSSFFQPTYATGKDEGKNKDTDKDNEESKKDKKHKKKDAKRKEHKDKGSNNSSSNDGSDAMKIRNKDKKARDESEDDEDEKSVVKAKKRKKEQPIHVQAHVAHTSLDAQINWKSAAVTISSFSHWWIIPSDDHEECTTLVQSYILSLVVYPNAAY